MAGKNDWRQSFTRKLEGLRSQWIKNFEEHMRDDVGPAFDEIASFVGEHGFRASSPLVQPDRRSFKFEMTENAYVLMTIRHNSVEEVVVKCEYFAPGADPGEYEVRAGLHEVNRGWAKERFQEALDTFVDALDKRRTPAGGSTSDLELLAV